MTSLNLSDQLLDHFKITNHIPGKKGGQKSVHYVTIDGSMFALKIVDNADERFKREVDICKQFEKNDGIPIIHKIEKFGDETIILEEYIDGNDLSELITDFKGDEIKVCKLLHSIALILDPVWRKKYVHRDLKPENIRVRHNGNPVVLDFGIARALDEKSITLVGQPLSFKFASPEQFDGQKKLISYRTDFFCLGIVAYYLFTNKFPFGNSYAEIEAFFKNEELKVDSGNDIINNFCNTVFKKYPSERPRKIEDFINLIEL